MTKFRVSCFICILLWSSLSIMAQNNQTDSLGQKQGKWVQYNTKGNKVYEGVFVDNQPQGTFLRYYSDGRLMSKLYHLPNSNVVYAEIYYANSHKTLKAKGKYIGKFKDSLWQYYTPQAQLQSEGHYHLDKKEGVWKYYKKSILVHEASYQADTLHGVQRYYFSSGHIAKESHYQHQQRQGDFRLYYPNGQTRLLGQYTQGEPNGKWQYFRTDGSLHYQEAYAQGKRLTRTDAQGKPYTPPAAPLDTTNLHLNLYDINF